MKPKLSLIIFSILLCCFFFNCTTAPGIISAGIDSSSANNGGFASQVAWGRHLVVITGCGDCHTPKLMTAQGPVPDTSRMLAGCSSAASVPAITQAQTAKGISGTLDETAWTGPWGTSFSANITSDSTGIGAWKEEQFIYCLRNGVSKGLPNSRMLMPPMPWRGIGKMTDNEIKAMFAYLKSTKPIHNTVPAYQPPGAIK